jgi:hypothetical protein
MTHDHIVDKLANKINRTRSDIKEVKKLVINIRPSNTAEAGEPTPRAQDMEIPVSPRKEDYKLVNHWTPEKYNTFRHPKRGTTPDKGDDPIICLFMEDEHGNVIPASTRRQVTRDLKAFWQGKYEKNERLDNLTHLGWDIRQEFRAVMETSYPWLRLCEGHWKADQLWSNHFSQWKPARATVQNDATQSGTLKREHSVDEDEAGPSSKRPKTVAPEIPTWPRPTKNVSNPFHSIYTLLNTRRTLCI